MNPVVAIFWCICFAAASEGFVSAVTKNETLRIDLSPGIQFYMANDKAGLIVRMSALIRENEIDQRDSGRRKFQGEILQRIGSAMMMVPVMIQLITLPGTLASIKMSLLRSIFIGKIALAIMFYNIIKNSLKAESVVLVHKPEYHDHYYDPYHKIEDDGGWWGRRRKRRAIFR